MPFTFTQLTIPDVILVEPKVFGDERGFFLESYKRSEFIAAGIEVDFVQDNHSRSQKGVLRGLHFQMPPKAQGKLVRVVKGAIFDVAVDIRKDSSTFKQWVGEELNEVNCKMLYIPPGFAHGFLTLSNEVHLLYKCTDEYSSEHDSGIRWNDPELDISWQIDNPIVSEKDKQLPLLKDARVF